MESKKYVYLFREGNAKMRNLLGGKGANLAEMTNLGIPVPQGFTITTEACTKYYEDNKKLSDEVISQIYKALEEIQKETKKSFGSIDNPLLVSVRSGARVSMPGMMDTILNLGLNDETVKAVSRLTNNERFAYDSYRRFIQMFSDVVMGLDKRVFEDVLEDAKQAINAKFDTDLTAEDLKKIVEKYKEIYKKEVGEDFPQDPKVQLLESVNAVFRSWDNPRAIVYRRLNDIPGNWGTAVNIQAMVFGNMGNTSGTGVAFTRDPATGENKIFGEYLINAQGEDVVAGIRTPQPITKLKEDLPSCYEEFINIAEKLENHYRDMQDMEFTIEQGKLYFLQTRNGKRTAQAALKIAVDMVNEGLITKEEALLKVEPKQLDTLLHPNFDQEELKKATSIAKGLPASPGAACGKVYFTAEEAKEKHELGEKVILLRVETSPEDIEGMVAAEGILTVRGGMTSHAAVVARGMGKCCVAGCADIKVFEKENTFQIGEIMFKKGDYISIDGSTGKVYGEAVKTVAPEISGYFGTFMEWADNIRKLKIRTNADTPKDAKQAVEFGAEGIGLCRTEHMFFGEDRIKYVRQLIISEDLETRERILDKLFEFQKDDFYQLFKDMSGKQIIIRLLDLPLHEFLPTRDKDIELLAKELGKDFREVKFIVDSMKEFNPMLGHRGCRLGMTNPEIYRMQTRAIISAVIEVEKEKNISIVPEIMIPLVGIENEIKEIRRHVTEVADELIAKENSDMKYMVGTMIEIPRAALLADKIANHADFFSFGTNDLTQMSFGFSRDDADSFLKPYIAQGVVEFSPFESIDTEGVGKLMKMAVKLGRESNPDLHIGICGEHGGDPRSIAFCDKIGLNYVSCAPYLVPVARLAAAQSAIANNK